MCVCVQMRVCVCVNLQDLVTSFHHVGSVKFKLSGFMAGISVLTQHHFTGSITNLSKW